MEGEASRASRNARFVHGEAGELILASGSPSMNEIPPFTMKIERAFFYGDTGPVDNDRTHPPRMCLRTTILYRPEVLLRAPPPYKLKVAGDKTRCPAVLNMLKARWGWGAWWYRGALNSDCRGSFCSIF